MAGILIFLLTYVLISARRLGRLGLDRAATALLGAAACVVVGVLSPAQAVAAVNRHTLLLLLGVMGMGAFLALDGFFDRAAAALARWAGTPARLLAAVVWGTGGLAALITNDAVCVLAAPLAVGLIRGQGLAPLPFLLAVATAANSGSVATLVGNPQNMLCGILGHLSYRHYLLLMGPVAVLALAVNHALLRLLFRRELRGRLPAATAAGAPARVLTRDSLRVLLVILGTAVAFTLGTDLAWTAAVGFAVLFPLQRRRARQVWRRLDWSVLVFFAGLFVVVEGLVRSGAPAWFFARLPLWQGAGEAAWARLAGLFLLGSNVVSNVPFILVVRDQMATVPDPTRAWQLLAMASTFAGNLTLLGSVANIIVAEKGREVGGLGFGSYLRLGLPLALLTTALGTAWVLAVG